MALKRLYKAYQLSRIAREMRFRPEEALLVFSDPRGGSTWLTEALLTLPESAVVWEPLHLRYNPHMKDIGFSWRQYIPHDAEWPEAKGAFDKILSAQVLNVNTAYLNEPRDYLRANQLLVKFCRGNALLPWLVEQYDFVRKPVHLLRHPFAVVSSQLKQGGWVRPFVGYEIPTGKFADIYAKHSEFLATVRCKEEALLVGWCITNGVPLRSANREKWMLVHYEHLFMNPQEQMAKIFQEWKLPIPPDLFRKLNEESKTTVSAVNVDDRLQQLSKWKNEFSSAQVERFMEILTYFGIELYDTDVMPHGR